MRTILVSIFKTEIYTLKKLSLISFILMLFYIQSGYYFSYLLQKFQVKQEFHEKMRKLIPDHELVSIAASDPGIIWEEENEFFYQGEMYDVVRIKWISGKRHFLCLPDHAEKKLVKHFTEVTSHNRKQENKQSVYKIFPDLQLIITDDLIVIVELQDNSMVLQSEKLPDRTEELLSPPPNS